MNHKLVRILSFALLLSILLVVVIAIAQILPYLFITALAFWMLWRRPWLYPNRVDPYARKFAQLTAELTERTLKLLMIPLLKWP